MTSTRNFQLMKLFTTLAAACIGASLITATPAEARDPRVPKTPSVDFLAGTFAGGYCLYRTGFYEKDAVFARTNDAGLEMGMTPEEVFKMVDSPAFMPLVESIIRGGGGCIKLSNQQLSAWEMRQRATQIIR